MDQGIIFSQMETFMKVNSRMEIVKEKENIHGPMRVSMKENGYVIK